MKLKIRKKKLCKYCNKKFNKYDLNIIENNYICDDCYKQGSKKEKS